MIFYRLSLLVPALILAACGQGESEVFNAEAAAQKWNRAEKIWTEAELNTLYQGEKRYRENCSACHARDGKGDNQIGAPALSGSPLALGQKSDLILQVLKSKKGSSMPAFSASLSDEELAVIASYVRNALGNNLDDIVIEADVTRLR